MTEKNHISITVDVFISDHEKRIVEYLSNGLTVKEIAGELLKKDNITRSHRTVESDFNRLMDKTHCTNKHQLVKVFLKNGLIE